MAVVAQGKSLFAIKDDSVPTSIFRVASISKVLTSLALAHLVDQGEIGLEDEAQKYLPIGASLLGNLMSVHTGLPAGNQP